MNPIAQAVLSVVAFVVIVVVTLEVARKKAKAKGQAFPDFRYIRISMLTLALAAFAGGIYLIVDQIAPTIEDRGQNCYSCRFLLDSYLLHRLPLQKKEMKTEPNNVMEPIPVAVTGCAGVHSAPSTSMAHL